MTTTAYDFSARDLRGDDHGLEQYRGKVLLIVNVASKCGFTPQYAGLEALYRQHADQGLVVLGFPCNQFGAQEPGDDADIRRFCDERYGVTFPLFAKIDVNGAHAHPLFRWLKEQRPGVLGTRRIKWNFTKFLVGRDGQVIRRYAPTAKPEDIAADLRAALG